MAQTEWIVFSCRACRGIIKLSPGLAVSGSVICPRCRTKVSVPTNATRIEETVGGSALPAARSAEPGTTSMRGQGREDWEVGSRPVGGELDFRARLHSTSEEEFKNDPDHPVMKRVNLRRRKYESTQQDFDQTAENDAPEAEGGEVSPERRRRRHTHYRQRGRGWNDPTVRVLLILVLLLSAGAMVAGYRRLTDRGRDRPRDVYTQVKPDLPADADGPKLEQRAMAEFAPRMAVVVKKFAAARTVDEMLPLLRDRARVEPLVRAWYKESRPWQPFEIRNTFDPADIATVDGNFLHIDLVLLNFETMPLALERDGGSFLVDWESFTGYGEVEWEDFPLDRPVQPVLMRVFLEQSPGTDYYNEDFADERKWNCLLMRDRTGAHQFSAYTERGSAADIALKQRLYGQPGPTSIRRCAAVVKVRFAAGGKSGKQVQITEFLENGWVFREGNDPAPPPAPERPGTKGPQLWPLVEQPQSPPARDESEKKQP